MENSIFDVNILADALKNPNVELSFPLPNDKETYIDSDVNTKVKENFSVLIHFFNFFTNINFGEIYKRNEYKYSVNKMRKDFNTISGEYMKNRLEITDEKLDEIVYNLVELELRMNLIVAKDFPKRFKEVKSFMVKYYTKENEKNLPKFGSRFFTQVCYLTVIKTVTKMFPNGVWVSRKELSSLYQKYLEDPMSIVILPNHQSHIDYVIMHLIMIRFSMSIPTVIAGENLNVAVFGGILKGLGAIFIKRSFNNELYTEKNLTNYMEWIFLNKIHFEVFIEGTRSRDGKLLLPKYGILKNLTSIYLKQHQLEKNEDFDLLMQPMAITYERIYEADGYLDELVGQDKKQESFGAILKTGLSNLVYGVDSMDKAPLKSSDGFLDNSNRTLHGKIYVKLAESFRLSSYIEDPANQVDSDSEDAQISEQNVNLKKLGFKILHAVNEERFLTHSAIVGITIQTFYYKSGKRQFEIEELLPMLQFLVSVLQEEDLNSANRQTLNDISELNKNKKIELIKSQILKFFRYTRVNPTTNQVRIENSFELLYYKNLSIQIIIHKCLTAFILLKTLDLNQISKLFYIFTGFLKNEFLFDYNYNEANSVSLLLQKFHSNKIISTNYEILDEDYLRTLSILIEPFIKSFMICVENLNYTVGEFYANSQNRITEKQLINDSLMLKDFPTTKSLLRIIQRDNAKHFESESSLYQIETYNKQYLLSFLFYLNNLKLIKIFKNKSKTKAYVIIKNSKDLNVILKFLQQLILKDTVDEVLLSYMIDIVDKIQNRSVGDYAPKL